MPIWFTLPEAFHELDIEQPAETRAIQMAEAFESFLPTAESEQKLHLILSIESAIQEYLKRGLIHFSHCLYRSFDDSVVSGALLVTAENARINNRHTYVLEALQNWKEESGIEGQLIQIPYGPAAVQVADLSVDSPEILSLSGGEDSLPDLPTLPLQQQQVTIPTTSGDEVISFTMITQSYEPDWEENVDILSSIVRTVSDRPVYDSNISTGIAAKVHEDFG